MTEGIMTFQEYVNTMGGSGFIYGNEASEILNSWKDADWIKVNEYIAPIASEILTDAAETNRPLYEKLMLLICEVHQELKKDSTFQDGRPNLTIIK